METPPEATLAGFDIRTPRAGAVRPMSQVVAILTPRPRPVCSLGDASLIKPSLAVLLASRNTRAAPRVAGNQHRGPMGRSDEYRRHATHCLEMANTLQDPKGRAALLQMAQVWLRLAQRHDEEETSDQLDK